MFISLDGTALDDEKFAGKDYYNVISQQLFEKSW